MLAKGVLVLGAALSAWSQTGAPEVWIAGRAGRVTAPAGFRAAGFVGSAEPLWVRASADGSVWTDWVAVEPGEDALAFFGDLNRHLEWDGAPPEGLRVLFIDPGFTARKPAPARLAADAPPVVTRSAWGCPPETCPFRGTPSYTTVTHLVVHHTAGANQAADWAAVLRSIYVLHTQGNGWSDVGYNYLVDPNGVLYEGRAGGDGVLGAHFSGVNGGTMGVSLLGTYSAIAPPEPAIETLRAMLAWQAEKWKLDPGGQAPHASSGLTLNVISGHRDAGLSPRASGTTECPGNGLYVLLPRLRRELAPAETACRGVVCLPAAGGAVRSCGAPGEPKADWLRAEGGAFTASSNAGARRTGAIEFGRERLTVVQAGVDEAALACVEPFALTAPLAAGGLLDIAGENLASGEAAAAGLPLPVSLGGTAVEVNGRAAPLFSVSPGHLRAQLPPNTNTGSARVAVSVNGQRGPETLVWITEAAPRILTGADGRAFSTQAGDVLTVWLTGAGAVGGAFPAAGSAAGDGAALPVGGPWSAAIGGRSAGALFLGLAPGLVGVYQANLRLAADAGGGEQPLAITVSGAASDPVPVLLADQ